MKSFAPRLSRTNAFIITIFTVLALAVSVIVLLIQNAQLTISSVMSARSMVDSALDRYQAQHVPLTQAAQAVATRLAFDPQVRIAIFNDKGQLLAGDTSLRTEGQRALTLIKTAPAEFPEPPPPGLGPLPKKTVVQRVNTRVEMRYLDEPGPVMRFLGLPAHHFETFRKLNGGYAIIAGNPQAFNPTMWGYVGFMVALAFLAICASWYFTARDARRALSPVQSVAAALRRFAGGDFSRFTPAAEEENEAGELFSAYNAAASTGASAIRERARLEVNMRQFVADAGHELRTPLTVIMGYIDVLQRGAIAEAELARRILDTMRNEGDRMRGLIGKLLLLARLESVDSHNEELVDVNALTHKVVQSLQPVANGSPIHFQGSGPVYAMADESELREALYNILDNAMKYGGGTRIEGSVTADDGQAVVTISDAGPGMNEEERSHAFERFYRGNTPRDIPGSGLGLAIAKRSVERSHGSIALDSAPQRGTQVTIRLPLAKNV